MERYASMHRKTNETEVTLELCLDGGERSISTGVGFFDHMLTALAFYAGFGLDLTARGDLHVDAHHTVEDVGIVLGQALREALGDKRGIRRFGSACIPMDEALCRICIDISGRSYLVYDVPLTREYIGEFETEMLEEFFIAFANNSKMTIHVASLYGRNNHHIVEGIFKCFGRTLKQAVTIDPNVKGVPSTKGVLE